MQARKQEVYLVLGVLEEQQLAGQLPRQVEEGGLVRRGGREVAAGPSGTRHLQNKTLKKEKLAWECLGLYEIILFKELIESIEPGTRHSNFKVC